VRKVGIGPISGERYAEISISESNSESKGTSFALSASERMARIVRYARIHRHTKSCLIAFESGYHLMNPIRRLAAAMSAILWIALIMGVLNPAGAQDTRPILIDDFESYEEGALPTLWNAQFKGRLVPLTEAFFNERERVDVHREDGNQFARAFAQGEAVHVNMENGADFDWDTRTHPVLSWDWRAVELPEGAREDRERLNDSGAGMYIIFSIDGVLVKRPKIIKYVYSSTLPVGTTASYGKLKVIVVASALDGVGDWQRIERDVAQDHRDLFGEDPPRRPLRLRIWADSDNTDTVAISDYDNVMLKPRR